MNLVSNLNDIMKNALTIDNYLKGSTDYEYAVSLIQRGVNLVAIKNTENYSFYPSRFMGYKNNSMKKHESNVDRDGRITTPAISKILGKLSEDDQLEDEYIKYCNSLGIKVYNKKRTYWKAINSSK